MMAGVDICMCVFPGGGSILPRQQELKELRLQLTFDDQFPELKKLFDQAKSENITLYAKMLDLICMNRWARATSEVIAFMSADRTVMSDTE